MDASFFILNEERSKGSISNKSLVVECCRDQHDPGLNFFNIILTMFVAKIHKESSRGILSNKSLDGEGGRERDVLKYFYWCF